MTRSKVAIGVTIDARCLMRDDSKRIGGPYKFCRAHDWKHYFFLVIAPFGFLRSGCSTNFKLTAQTDKRMATKESNSSACTVEQQKTVEQHSRFVAPPLHHYTMRETKLHFFHRPSLVAADRASRVSAMQQLVSKPIGS
jgi:hypothetical protein